MSKGTLYYFALHGRASAVRMLLDHAKVEFKDVKYAFEEWPEHKDSMPNKQVPAWQPEGSDVKLGQSSAILHMLGVEHGYYSAVPLEVHAIEFCLEIMNDFVNSKCIYPLFADAQTPEQLDALKAELEKYYRQLNEHLAGKKFCAGDRITIADFVTYSGVINMAYNTCHKNKEWNDADREILEKHEHVMKWIAVMQEECKDHVAKRGEHFM